MKVLVRYCFAGMVLAAAGPVDAVEIAPHRATYDLVLKHSSPNSEVADVSGSMQFEWADSCDGWTVTQRLIMSFLYQSGEELKLGWNLVTWESKDGLRYRFFVRKHENGELAKEFRGEARLDGAGKGGRADYLLPDVHKVDLPPGTLFPTAHSIKLLEEAEAGHLLLWATVFDGIDEEGISGVGAAVGKRLETLAVSKDLSPLLTAGPSWRIELAFFAASGQAAEPEHEQSLRLHGNGVAQDLVFSYEDFSVDATLKELEALPPPPC